MKKDLIPWVEKYRPKKFQEVIGQEEVIKKIKDFLNSFNLQKVARKRLLKKALILHGSPGVGKTTLAYAIANETNAEIFELNASDLRNKNKLREILKPAIEQKSLVKKNKIILVDEVDGISAVDRGGLTELLSLIQLTSYPVIITANDIWNKKLNSLRKSAEVAQLKEIGYMQIKNMMIQILQKENHFIDNEVLTKLAIKARGDLRAAINDLQSISKVKDHALIEFDERNKESDIFNALRKVFKGKPTNETLGVYDSVNMNIDEIMLWVEENIPIEYSEIELARAYEKLSRTDIFKRRIYRQQYWRFLVYENIFLSFGIAASKKDVKTGFTNYKKPTRILKIWLNNQRSMKKKSIAQKYAKLVHVGLKRAMHEFYLIKEIIKSNPEIQKELKLNDEEVEYVMN
ncbi:MAG: replication factor C large subunit [Candidatus Pacearchaeota archaeon]|jgi:replication factor C large subunit